MSEWQDISTAPKDGRMAIYYRPLAHLTNDPHVAVKRSMSSNQQCWSATVPEGQEPTNPTDGSCHCTHWMPIPPPPKNSGYDPTIICDHDLDVIRHLMPWA
jgi:hypothetical protein